MESKLIGTTFSETIRCPSHAPFILCLRKSNPGPLEHASSKLKVISILPRRPPPYAFRENLEGGAGTAAGVCLLSTGPGMPGAAAAGGLKGVETGPFRPWVVAPGLQHNIGVYYNQWICFNEVDGELRYFKARHGLTCRGSITSWHHWWSASSKLHIRGRRGWRCLVLLKESNCLWRRNHDLLSVSVRPVVCMSSSASVNHYLSTPGFQQTGF